MCEPLSVFLIWNRLSVATFFRQMTSSVLASLLTLPPVLSVLSEDEEQAVGGKERRKSIKPNWHRGMRARYQKAGWWGMNDWVSGHSTVSEVKVYMTLYYWNNNQHSQHQGAKQSVLLHCSLSAEGNGLASLFLTLSLSLTDNHSLFHIWRERE